MGIYDTTMQIAYSLAIILAGFVGDFFGFEWVLIFAGILFVFRRFYHALVVQGKKEFLILSEMRATI